MRSPAFYLTAASLLLTAAAASGADDPSAMVRTNLPTPTSASKDTRRPARGPLPDPVLLDGSAQPAEKKPDYGMLGEFEIPGDENAKQGDKVGGQQTPPPAGAQGGGQQQAAGQQQGGGGGQQQANQSGQQGGGGGQAGGQQGAQGGGGGAQGAQGAGGAQGGAQGGGAGLPGGAPVGQNDPNASANGIQVGEIMTDPSLGPQGQGGAGAPGGVQKPQQVALGDPSMQIKADPNAPGAVGQMSGGGSTQQMESKIGHGTGGGAGASTPAGRGVEKGRVMPAGL